MRNVLAKVRLLRCFKIIYQSLISKKKKKKWKISAEWQIGWKPLKLNNCSIITNYFCVFLLLFTEYFLGKWCSNYEFSQALIKTPLDRITTGILIFLLSVLFCKLPILIVRFNDLRVEKTQSQLMNTIQSTPSSRKVPHDPYFLIKNNNITVAVNDTLEKVSWL